MTMHDRAPALVLLAGTALLSGELLGRRRGQMIARIVMFTAIILYGIWRLG